MGKYAQSRVFLFWSKAGKFKIYNQNSGKNGNIVILHSKTTRKTLKGLNDWNFYRDFKDGWRRRTISERVQYYPEDLEIFVAETETAITESQEAIDDFINQQKSANTNKKTATDMNTPLRYMEANDMKNEKTESLPASKLERLLSNSFFNARRKTKKKTSQQRFPVFSPVYSDT